MAGKMVPYLLKNGVLHLPEGVRSGDQHFTSSQQQATRKPTQYHHSQGHSPVILYETMPFFKKWFVMPVISCTMPLINTISLFWLTSASAVTLTLIGVPSYRLR
jgi:hypothetical protein